MSSHPPSVINEKNLSLAWARTYQLVTQMPGKEMTALNVSFTGLTGEEIEEDSNIRCALDTCLEEERMQEIETVADTIFPQPLWVLAKGDRTRLFIDYMENLPAYVKMAPAKNNRGLYFARLTAWNVDPKTGQRSFEVGKHLEAVDGNQLEFIIQQCRAGVRRSMFQTAIFDPARDLTPSAQLGFPCMQQLFFIPNFSDGTSMLDAFYATQQLFEKAYGNFLGLARLGRFIGHETGLKLDRVNLHLGIEKIDKRPRPGAAHNSLKVAIDEALCIADSKLSGIRNLVDAQGEFHKRSLHNCRGAS